MKTGIEEEDTIPFWERHASYLNYQDEFMPIEYTKEMFRGFLLLVAGGMVAVGRGFPAFPAAGLDRIDFREHTKRYQP